MDERLTLMGNSETLVSIVIPTYNRPLTLREAIHSALAQQSVDVEVIVVDDQSTDDTASVVAQMAKDDARIIYHRIEKKGRASVCRNKGLSLSHGMFVTFLDDDDLLRPEKTRLQLDLIQDFDLCVGQTELFIEKPGDTGKIWNTFHGKSALVRYCANDIVWGTAAPLWRKSSITRIGGWDARLPFHQDLELHLRALLAGLTVRLHPQVVVDYRNSPTGRMTTDRKKGIIEELINFYLALQPTDLSPELAEAFATTYLFCAIGASSGREDESKSKAMSAYLAIDPIPARRWALPLLLSPEFALIRKLGKGGKLALRTMGLFGLHWRDKVGKFDLSQE